MNISFNFPRPDELREEDASLSFGYITLEARGVVIGFFQDKNCRIFSTTAWLLDIIFTLQEEGQQSCDWIGDGYGATFKVECIGRAINFQNDSGKIELGFSSFVKAMLLAVQSLLASSAEINSDIVAESAYCDLKSSFERLRSLGFD